MINKTFLEKFILLSNNSRNLYADTISDCAKQCGITKPEADLLLFFGNNPNFTNACDAVNYRKFSKSYVSKALSSLSKRKFITLKEDINDRRYQQIKINDCAKQILTKLQECQLTFFRKMKQGISDKDFTIFLHVIEKITDNYLKESTKK